MRLAFWLMALVILTAGCTPKQVRQAPPPPGSDNDSRSQADVIQAATRSTPLKTVQEIRPGPTLPPHLVLYGLDGQGHRLVVFTGRLFTEYQYLDKVIAKETALENAKAAGFQPDPKETVNLDYVFSVSAVAWDIESPAYAVLVDAQTGKILRLTRLREDSSAQ